MERLLQAEIAGLDPNTFGTGIWARRALHIGANLKKQRLIVRGFNVDQIGITIGIHLGFVGFHLVLLSQLRYRQLLSGGKDHPLTEICLEVVITTEHFSNRADLLHGGYLT